MIQQGDEAVKEGLREIGITSNIKLTAIVSKLKALQGGGGGGGDGGVGSGGKFAINTSGVTKSGISIPCVNTNAGKETHVFLTHDWGKDEQGRSNHDRVHKVCEGLKVRGITPWFDSDRMTGQIVDTMCKGIDQTHLLVVFVTERYIQKIGGDDLRDNCKVEFSYATGAPNDDSRGDGIENAGRKLEGSRRGCNVQLALYRYGG